MIQKNDPRRFVGLVLVLLLPCFVLWMAISPWIAAPAVFLCDALLTNWLPDIVDGVQLKGSQALVMTHFGEWDGRIVPANVAGYQMGFPTDVRILTYSIPFYAALTFATPQKENFSRFGWGLWILYPLVVLGLVCVVLKDLLLGLGPALYAESPAFFPNANVIGILYQMSILIVPPLAPVLLWAWQCRESPFLQRLVRVKRAPAS